MCHRLKTKHNLRVTQEMVRLLLRQIDPVGVSDRQKHRLRRRTYHSRGPNFCWHIDGYDKLRPYGILISGCIDGFSRRIMWLKASYTNHDPFLIAGYFLNCAEDNGGYPYKCQTDCGTENVHLAALHTYVTGRQDSHKYGTSPSNQRIEAWWSFYRRSTSQWWIELFESLIENDQFHPGHVLEIEVLRFCFLDLLQQNLDEITQYWNSHRIRPSRGAVCPAGIPNELYYLPPEGAVDCMVDCTPIPAVIVGQLSRSRQCEDEDFYDYLKHVCSCRQWLPADSATNAKQLYVALLAELHANGTIV